MPKTIKIVLILFVILFSVGVLGSIFLTNYVEEKVRNTLLDNKSSLYENSLGSVKFNLLSGSLSLENLKISPTEEAISLLNQGENKSNSVIEIFLRQATVDEIDLAKILFHKEVEIADLKANDIWINVLKNKEIIKKSKRKFKPDSINLKQIDGLRIRQIAINNLNYVLQDSKTQDTIFRLEPLSFVVDGVALEKNEKKNFSLKSISQDFVLKNFQIDLPTKSKQIGFSSIYFNFNKNKLSVNDFFAKPSMKKEALAETYEYNDEVNHIEIKSIALEGFNFYGALSGEIIFADSLIIKEADFQIYKDKRKPFNKNIYKELPHIKLKKLQTPIHITKVNIHNSRLAYEERYPKNELLLNVRFEKINGELDNLTSISELRDNPLKAKLTAQLMDEAPLKVDFSFDMQDGKDDFKFSGEIGKSKFKLYDEVLFPLFGLKIFNGNLQKMTFHAVGNNFGAYGNMTMLYDNLKATAFKHDKLEEDEVISWAVNHVIHSSNPGKNGKTRHVKMNHNRVTYKGIGSLLWRTMQDGILKSLAPEAMNLMEKVQKKKAKKELRKKHKNT